jgi:acetyl-CoA synthetase
MPLAAAAVLDASRRCPDREGLVADNTVAFRAARDYLISVADQYEAACDGFAWPDLTGTFNWATDWFDVIARGNDRTALWLLEEDGAERRYSYDTMARRSDQVATWLRGLGVGKGDRVILMLGNQVELWESMLAVMKLGAVILPTTAKFADVPGDYAKICVGIPAAGWHSYQDAYQVEPEMFTVATDAADPVLICFTSGTTTKPKLVQHTQVSYPVGHLTTMYWIGVRPGDVHLTISSPGWAKHAWSLFYAPWIAEAPTHARGSDA